MGGREGSWNGLVDGCWLPGLVGARLCGPSVLISLALGGEGRGGGCGHSGWMEDALEWFAQAIDSGRKKYLSTSLWDG